MGECGARAGAVVAAADTDLTPALCGAKKAWGLLWWFSHRKCWTSWLSDLEGRLRQAREDCGDPGTQPEDAGPRGQGRRQERGGCSETVGKLGFLHSGTGGKHLGTAGDELCCSVSAEEPVSSVQSFPSGGDGEEAPESARHFSSASPRGF